MAHIPDGVLAAPVLIGGLAVAAALVGVGVKRLDTDRIPQTAVLAATFFVASLITIPVGLTSVHLLLNGLMGLVLGWVAAPAILVGLTLQAAFFGFGGVTSLGVNTVTIALPALLVAAVLGPRLRRARSFRSAGLVGALAGLTGAVGTAALVCLALALSGPEYAPALGVIAATYVPLMVGEAVVGGMALGFMTKVKPEMLGLEQPVHG
jgi:cobalt/nickel transport system permease protein